MATLFADVKAAMEAAGDDKLQGLLNALGIILNAIFGYVGGEI